jgi:DNA-binding MarR family transcriptional regulator
MPVTRKATPAPPASDAALVVELAWTILDTFTRMKAASDRVTGAAGQSTPRFSVLREIAVRGPMSVAAIARVRRAARQGVQRLATELAADGLVTFVENPQHRRSPLLELTPRGRRIVDQLLREQDAVARAVAPRLDARKVRHAIEVLRSFGVLVER